MRAAPSQSGFTLIELIVTLVLTAIVVSFMALFVSAPVQGFADQARRARLVDAADTALGRMTRDVRRALPNSVRVRSAGGGSVALELIGTLDGGRYRAEPPGTADQVLDFTAGDASFNVIGGFTQLAKPWSSAQHHLAIYNVGVPGADAYELANVITPPGTAVTVAADGSAPGEDRVTVSPAFDFAFGSPRKRVYLVDGPVSYVCDPLAGTLVRYAGYAIGADHADRDSHGELVAAGGTPSLIVNRVADCTFSYTPGTAQRAGLVTLELAIADGGESIALLAQAHVANAP
jgi:MSHA biogenesis protein MshO